MIKGSIYQESFAIINTQAPNEYIKQTLTELKAEINNSAIIDGHFSTLLSIMDRTTMQKINKEIRLE